MRQEFPNNTVARISPGSPMSISSATRVAGVTGAISGVTVSFDILHTFTSDLVIALTSPDGRRVVLVNREGGSGDNFIGTVFDDRSTSSIARARPPFQGRFRPSEPLSAFDGADANGDWTLVIDDRAFQDGGFLIRWTLGFTTEPATATDFSIDFVFGSGLTVSQRQVFSAAAARWSEIITGATDGTVLNVVINADGVPIDGGGTTDGNVLGQAGPRGFHANGLPSSGIMEFDTFDLDSLENNGSLLNVIHEMGHVLGHGTIWRDRGVLVAAGSNNPRFLGVNAMLEFGVLLGTDQPTPVPVANRGGRGTADSHWRETTFGSELLTGRLNGGVNPISRMSIASLSDLGYRVDLDAAEPYQLPGPAVLALLGTDGEGSRCCCGPR
jgi:subtilisin-like proprotein convertase family protein